MFTLIGDCKDFLDKDITINGENIKVCIGNEKSKNYIQSKGLIIVLDLSDKEKLKNVAKWINYFRLSVGTNKPIILYGINFQESDNETILNFVNKANIQFVKKRLLKQI